MHSTTHDGESGPWLSQTPYCCFVEITFLCRCKWDETIVIQEIRSDNEEDDTLMYRCKWDKTIVIQEIKSNNEEDDTLM